MHPSASSSVPAAALPARTGASASHGRIAAISASRRPRPAETSADPLDLLRDRLLGIAAAAAEEDQDGAFPAASIRALAEIGLLAAPLGTSMGGLGWGTEPSGAASLGLALRLVGRASLPLGRLYEGHVNALRLVQRLGTPAQVAAAARDAQAGRLFAVWNTEAPGEPPLTITPEGRLAGRKVLCSGAGHVTRALVTARLGEAPPQLLLISLDPDERADNSVWTAQGMRASATGAVDFTGIAAEPGLRIGAPGDYTRQPDFSAGAWRFAAVHCGGAEAVLEALRDHLRRTGRGGDANQAARLGQAAIAAETARLWVEQAARMAEAPEPGPQAAAYVNLARLAVERAALDVMELAQRSIGLAAFLRPNPLERICRDLATYLRQPGPDRALAEGAAFLLAADAVPGDLWAAGGAA